jgi:hypothetical protein
MLTKPHICLKRGKEVPDTGCNLFPEVLAKVAFNHSRELLRVLFN